MTSRSLSVSNLAWDQEDNDLIFQNLHDNGINQIEGVVNKIADWHSITDQHIKDYKQYLDSKSITVRSLQSIFYNSGITDLKDEERVIAHMKRLIRISKQLGVKILVFGSPTMRKQIDNWQTKLKNLFIGIDYLLDGTGIELVIEPNAKIYGGEYFHTVPEIVEFIMENNLQNINTMIDTHNIILEGQDPIEVFDEYVHFISHVHISEPGLVPFIASDLHINFSKKLQELNYKNIITYEVLKHDNFHESVQSFSSIY